VDDNIYCVTTAVARGRQLLRDQGILLPYMQDDCLTAVRRGVIRLLKLAKAMKFTEQQALEYGLIAPSSKPVVQTALVKEWNRGKRNPSRSK
jgi:hypothetical protein